MLIILVLSFIILVIVGTFFFIRNREHFISSELIYENDFHDETFVQVLIRTEEDWKRYAELYGYDKDVRKIEFDKESVFICSFHEAKRFWYCKGNTRENGKEVLDIAFDKESKNKIYVYVLNKNNIISWEATGVNPDTKVRFE